MKMNMQSQKTFGYGKNVKEMKIELKYTKIKN